MIGRPVGKPASTATVPTDASGGAGPTEATAEFSSFFDREYPAVLRTVFLLMRDAGRAEDVTQEAFIQALQHWRKVSRYDVPAAWVRRVGIRLAMRQIRRERMRDVLERRLDPPSLNRSTDLDLADAIRSLTAPQRVAIVLHYYEDQPVDDIAIVLGCSPNTVKSHLHRGRDRIRHLLGSSADADPGGVDVD